jgi:acetyl-CoA synthetase
MRPTRDLTSAPPGRATPDTRAAPDVGLRRPARTRRSVVFPAPFGPNNAKHSPAASEKVTPANARVGPKERVRSPTSTIGAGDEKAVEDIRLELATLARGAQNTVSLQLPASLRVHHSATMTDIDVLLQENRKFEPPPEFTRAAVASSPGIYEEAARDPEKFWADQARELDWIKPWTKVLEWKPPHAKWFVGGKLNIAANCIDRHIAGPRRNKAALIWEGEPGDQRTLTYWDLYREVSRFSNVLKKFGARKGDRIAIYLPLIPEAAIAMLACARIGAIHSVVFGGFSPESLRDRINDAKAKILITADGGYRRGQVIPLKRNADKAVEETPTIEHVIVVQRRPGGAGDEAFADMKEGRDHWYHRLMKDSPVECEPEVMDAEDVLYILYTSGTTGKPKGIVHTTGGYLAGVTTTTKMVFDLKENDVFWCTADIGWVTGHSYLVYGPLANGATCVMYEGAPDWPERDRFWDIIERRGVTILYTAPTAIRAFMKWGDDHPAKHDLSSLRLLGSVGEPINPEAWMWYREHIGGNRCPIVDTWWQTETGAIVISPLPGITPTKPGSATKALPGYTAELLDSLGKRIDVGGGLLALTKPWPSMLRTIWGDDARYVETYFSKWPGRPDLYFPGDGAKRDSDEYFWILGRVDDVLNVAGHRIGTMEIESALVEHPAVAEAAVVGKAHELKGQAIAAFVTLRDKSKQSPALRDELREFVAKKIGALARPDDILFSADLPKTRSGKIMRRLLRDIAEGRALGDTTTLADPNVVANLKDQYEDKEG